jgi:hypothetical protein
VILPTHMGRTDALASAGPPPFIASLSRSDPKASGQKELRGSNLRQHFVAIGLDSRGWRVLEGLLGVFDFGNFNDQYNWSFFVAIGPLLADVFLREQIVIL